MQVREQYIGAKKKGSFTSNLIISPSQCDFIEIFYEMSHLASMEICSILSSISQERSIKESFSNSSTRSSKST